MEEPSTFKLPLSFLHLYTTVWTTHYFHLNQIYKHDQCSSTKVTWIKSSLGSAGESEGFSGGRRPCSMAGQQKPHHQPTRWPLPGTWGWPSRRWSRREIWIYGCCHSTAPSSTPSRRRCGTWTVAPAGRTWLLSRCHPIQKWTALKQLDGFTGAILRQIQPEFKGRPNLKADWLWNSGYDLPINMVNCIIFVSRRLFYLTIALPSGGAWMNFIATDLVVFLSKFPKFV